MRDTRKAWMQDGGDVRPEEVAAVEGADEGLLVEAGASAASLRVGVRDHGLPEDVLADRVHDVQQDEQERDAAAGSGCFSTSAKPLPAFIGSCAGRRRPRALTRRVHDAVEAEVQQQDARPRSPSSTNGLHAQPEEALGERRAQRGPGRRADRDQREEPLALRAGVDLVRVGPELGDGR